MPVLLPQFCFSNIRVLGLIYTAACVRVAFLPSHAYSAHHIYVFHHTYIQICHILFICSSVRHVGRFHLLSVMNNAMVNTGVQIPV